MFLASGSWQRFHLLIDDHHNRLGPIFRQPIAGTVEAVFVKSPSLLREVFAIEGKYPKHPLPEAWTFYNQLHNCRRGLFFMDDDEWLQTRRLLSPLMLRNDNRFIPAIERATDDLIARIHQHTSADQFVEMPNMIQELYHWSVCVLIRIMFGESADRMLSELSPIVRLFAENVQNIFEDTVPFQTISPQFAHKYRLKIWTKFEQSVDSTLSVADEIIDFGMKLPRNGLLRELAGLDETLIKRIFIDLITAAGDTTAFTTQWTLYSLAQSEHIQAEVRQEVMKCLAQNDTPLVRGSVREAMRLYPVATFIGRILPENAQLGDFAVPQHTLVLISMYSAGRDSKSFPEANRFEPSRWIRDPSTGALKNVANAYSSIPYALGSRNCIGQRIANVQMHSVIAKILRSFDVRTLNQLPIDIVMRLIIAPKEPIRFAFKSIQSKRHQWVSSPSSGNSRMLMLTAN